ncbi:methyl-CpG-binding domain protein 2-like [Clavelina lepadiformis]|uniref:MBD domain-containing protein n=1 Tax=Clavelina lepadiformis TaxID=159417 RepID=A0ABP0FTV6_CLALP
MESYNSSKKRTPAIGLPNGWMREETVRQNGLSRGKSDIYYLSPNGKKIRSKPELIRYLGNKYDLTCFDYRSGKMLTEKIRSRKGRSHDPNKVNLDTSIPNRQTASIFKQPVTKKTNHKSNKVKSEQTKVGSKVPQQVFKEKRLSGIKPMDVADTVIESIDLPQAIQGIGPSMTSEELLQQIASQLHSASTPITGQTSSNVVKDPCVWLNTQQPICKSFVVTENDIRKQESRVLAARERLEQALKQDADMQRQELMLLA